MTNKRTIEVGDLARVEGMGGLRIRLEGDRATEVELSIFEPPRFFEALLRGRSLTEVPDITARICGICPVAYQMSACRALEDALALEVPDTIVNLRRLIYCGEWIASHVLHMVLLHAPDFLGYPDALELARDQPDAVKRGLRLKKTGNTILRVVGGREVHPVNVRVGGFHRAPSRTELRALLPDLERGLSDARAHLEWTASFPFPELERDYEWVVIDAAEEYPLLGSRVRSSRGLDIDVREWPGHFSEEQVAHSTALRSSLDGRTYHVGPLARIHMGFDRLPPIVREAARAIGFSVPCANPFRGILARGLETLYAYAEAIRLVEQYEPPDPPFVELPQRDGVGHGCSEAPRGILYHRYEIRGGRVEAATIIPPTSQNQRSIEEDLAALAPMLAALDKAGATRRAEQAVRNYDPCISCATHFLDLTIERG